MPQVVQPETANTAATEVPYERIGHPVSSHGDDP
jgi:hypothetical protein